MADSVPPKPALVHSEDGGPIAVEIYELDVAAFGSFVAEVAEPRAIVGAKDITELGGWRAFVDAIS